jgi:quinol-cytochrome oxidoreductase complex cytochrome b subunit
MANKINKREGDKIFKIREDGTIMREDKDRLNVDEKKPKNHLATVGFILSLITFLGFWIICLDFLDRLRYSWGDSSERFFEFLIRRNEYLAVVSTFIMFYLISASISFVGIFKKPRTTVAIIGIILSVVVLVGIILAVAFFNNQPF